MAADETIWHGLNPAELLLLELETSIAVFDRRSGDTHLLSALPGTLLERLRQADADTGSLASRLAAEYGIPDGPTWREQVRHALEQLAGLGLAAPRPR